MAQRCICERSFKRSRQRAHGLALPALSVPEERVVTASSVASSTASNSPETPSVRRSVRACGPFDWVSQGGMRGKGDGEVAAAVRNVDPCAPRENRARGESLQIARIKRRIGGDDDHAGTIGDGCGLPRGEGESVFHTGTPSTPPALNWSAPGRHRPVSACCRPRRDDGRSPPPPERDRPGASADGTFFTGPDFAFVMAEATCSRAI